MTAHGHYERVVLMQSADMIRRIENCAWRDSAAKLITSGEWINQAIRAAVEANELLYNQKGT